MWCDDKVTQLTDLFYGVAYVGIMVAIALTFANSKHSRQPNIWPYLQTKEIKNPDNLFMKVFFYYEFHR